MTSNVPRSPARPNAQTKYRNKKTEDGFVRYELQVKKETKALFETMANAAAEEIAAPWDKRRRLATARAQLLDELLAGISHEFYALKEQITALEAEISTLTPAFMTSSDKNVVIPTSIQVLPSESQELKQLLANCYHQQQNMANELKKIKHVAAQYKELYDVTSKENEQLIAQLKEYT